MADIHTPVEKRLKRDVNAKNEIRRDLEKRVSLVRRLSEKLKKCISHQKISRYNSTIKRHRNQVEQLRVELLQSNEDLEKRIREEMKYSEKEVEEFKTRLQKETREMEEAGSKLEKIKAEREISEKTEDSRLLSSPLMGVFPCATKILVRTS